VVEDGVGVVPKILGFVAVIDFEVFEVEVAAIDFEPYHSLLETGGNGGFAADTGDLAEVDEVEFCAGFYLSRLERQLDAEGFCSTAILHLDGDDQLSLFVDAHVAVYCHFFMQFL
jgi:hypothetical protein